MSDLLLVDVGGTNMRYAYCESGANEIHKSEKISLKNLDNFDTIIGAVSYTHLRAHET